MIGTEIKKRRIAANLTQARLAQLSGVNQSTISDIESGVSESPGLLVIYRLAAALGCKASEIVRSDEDELEEKSA